jgi:hypothetical protein
MEALRLYWLGPSLVELKGRIIKFETSIFARLNRILCDFVTSRTDQERK